jgi:putative tricarboxylic transport membrane protein
MTAAIALFVFGAITAGLALGLPLGTLRAPGSGLFPFVLGLLLMALAAGHGVQLYVSRPKRAPQTPTSAPPVAPRRDGATQRVVLFMGVVALATALLETLGYALVSFLMMLALLQVLGIRKWRVSVPVALASAVVCYLVFVVWLKIPLPLGWLEF